MKRVCSLQFAVCSLILLATLSSCKPKEIIHVRTVTKVDSTAVMRLQEQLVDRSRDVSVLNEELRRAREENSRLQEEVSKHEIEYDTDKPIVPETGKPPVKKETTTESKSVMEKAVKDFEEVKAWYERRIEGMATKVSNLEYELDLRRAEKSDLEMRRLGGGLSWRWVFWSFLVGVVAGVVVYLVVWPKIGGWVRALRTLRG